MQTFFCDVFNRHAFLQGHVAQHGEDNETSEKTCCTVYDCRYDGISV